MLEGKISKAITSNPTLTPLDITCGKGLGFIPSAVDAPCSHPGKVGYEVNKTRVKSGMKERDCVHQNLKTMQILLTSRTITLVMMKKRLQKDSVIMDDHILCHVDMKMK